MIAYQPFLYPLPIWDYWAFLLIPLALGVSIVYKSIRCGQMSQVPRQAIEISFYIIISMVLAAVILSGITRLVV
jgi:TRAP-type mannitol/chloroaromatic compound transport system permease small subunit